MFHRQLQKDIRKQLHRFHDYARLITRHHNEEDVHRFRVSYKKLRALYRMMHYKHHKNGLPEQFKELYTASGTIRDLQLHYKAVSEYCSKHHKAPIIYLNHILTSIAGACTDFDNRYKHCSFSRLSHTITSHIPHTFNKRLQHWKQDNLDAISSSLSTDIDDNAIHEIRKHLKDLLYTRSYIQLSKNDEPAIESIGSYIDYQVLLQLLKANIHYAPAGEQTILKHAMHDWQELMTAKKKEVIKALHTYYPVISEKITDKQYEEP
ncbi:MAG: CHAD domain-containing protein [Bacteroidetes bacterium]|nr:CHAD domain-containing protein [Bacteroidota bacterium]